MSNTLVSPLRMGKSRHTRSVRRCLVSAVLALSALSGRAEDPLARLSAEALRQPPAVTISPSGRYVTLEDPSGVISLIEPASGSKKALAMFRDGSAVIVWEPGGRFLALAGGDSASIYQLPGGRLLHHWKSAGRMTAPQISPDGKYLSFIREHNLWVATDDGKSQRALTSDGSADVLAGEVDPLYAREFHIQTHYWWSPNSASIAYIETAFHDGDHYPVAGAALPVFRLKVVDVASGDVSTIAASSVAWPYLLRVAWHPDGHRIAAYRMNRPQTDAELSLYESKGDAFQEQTLLTEKDAYWVNAPATPVFVRGGKEVAVTSERSGHSQVYLYDLNGTLIRDLTPSDLEVYSLHAALDPAGAVFVSGSTGDRQQQNLYRIDLEGGAAKKLTGEPGWHETTLDSTGRGYLDRYSSASVPPALRWHGAQNRSRELTKPPATAEAVTNSFLTIKTHDGTLLPARLFTPSGFDAKKRYPLILYTFSGPQGRVSQDSWGGWQMAWNRSMVRNGYLVLSVDTRGSAGYGHLFEEYLHYRLGAQETTDLREVVDYVKRLQYVDSRRLGIWGCDYGAQIALHAMMEIPHGFKAGFADSPILDWDDYDAYFVERYLGLPESHIAGYDDSSPLDNVRRMTGEVLVVSSPDDPVIRPAQEAALDEALALPKNRKIAKQVHRISLDDPGYRSHADQLTNLFSAMTNFFHNSL